MDLNFHPRRRSLPRRRAAFLQDKLPARIAHKVKAGQRLTKADQEEWHAILNARGWLANHWPEAIRRPRLGCGGKVHFRHRVRRWPVARASCPLA
jgi:hypothetical protein